MREVPLTRGLSALVDDEDFAWLSQHKWYANATKPSGRSVYAARNGPKKTRPRVLLMHRLIIKAGSGDVVDHINRNTLDNRRSNLRLVDHTGNNLNSGLRCDNTSGRKNLYYHKGLKLWCGELKRYGVKKCKASKDRAVVEVWLDGQT